MDTSLVAFINKNYNNNNIKSIYLYNKIYNNIHDKKFIKYKDIEEKHVIYNFPIEICYLINLEILSICNVKEIIYIPNEIDNLIDEHTLMFVAIHELSHVMTKSIGHKSDFWQNFKFLLENAKDAGIHSPEDYKKSPQQYCGMTIHDNPYFDA